MKKIYRFFTSMSFMAFIFLALAFSMATATFIESSYGIPAARALVYNAWYFELLWALFALNLLNNIFKYRLLNKRRITIGLFHVAFIVMLLGAAVTRWFSFEGTMTIRENESADYILSAESYFFAGYEDQEEEEEVRFSAFTSRQFSENFQGDGENIGVKTVGFMPHAQRKAVPSENGEPGLDFVFAASDGQGMHSFTFRKGEVLDYPGFVAGFEATRETPVRFLTRNNQLYLLSAFPVQETAMGSQQTREYAPGDTIAVQNRILYHLNDFRFLIRAYHPSAVFTAVASEYQTHEQAVMVQVSVGGTQQLFPVFGHAAMPADTLEVPLGKGTLKLAYGAKIKPLPFRLHLKDFKLERYPGSQSPSSYASQVLLMDQDEGVARDVTISMNNTLTYKGYKFFQSSYDPDEKGTVLSVSYDFWGTWISYVSYFLLTLGFVSSLVNKHSHFRQLVKRLKNNPAKATLLVLLLTGLTFGATAQESQESPVPRLNQQVVDEFNELWVQGIDGRMKPVSSLASEVVRKVSRKSSLYGLSADEVVLSMMTYPEVWQKRSFIRVANPTVAAELAIDGKTISLQQLFDAQGNYRIAQKVQAAFNKPAALRNRVEKEYIYLGERVSICFMVFRGSLFNLFPRQQIQDPWYAPGEDPSEYSGADSVFIKSGFNFLLQALRQQNNTQALDVLNGMDAFQQKHGAGLLPSERVKKAEILYNKVNPFERIFPFYLLAGFLLLLVLFVNIFRQKPLPSLLKKSSLFFIILLFAIHTGGIILRWYISGRAPWSNGYESMVYVAWAAMLAGIIFGRRYPMVIGTAAFLAGIALFVAHLSWMNPEITPLVPVLKSYWLTIHVSVITASYGFIGLSAFLGILVLILMVLRKKSNQSRVNLIIGQLTTINQMSATLGLYFLTIGTFLGGIWANESWGRYWGWDPKETWSLITIFIYSFIVHMRLVPSLRGVYPYTVASVAGLASVIMTYFGVNYYLTGLHSYGNDLAGAINPALPLGVALLVGLMIWAYLKDQKDEKKKVPS